MTDDYGDRPRDRTVWSSLEGYRYALRPPYSILASILQVGNTVFQHIASLLDAAPTIPWYAHVEGRDDATFPSGIELRVRRQQSHIPSRSWERATFTSPLYQSQPPIATDAGHGAALPLRPQQRQTIHRLRMRQHKRNTEWLSRTLEVNTWLCWHTVIALAEDLDDFPEAGPQNFSPIQRHKLSLCNSLTQETDEVSKVVIAAVASSFYWLRGMWDAEGR